ncbi:hypothetical protein FOZ62_024421, partial [Perkinsus olseni]
STTGLGASESTTSSSGPGDTPVEYTVENGDPRIGVPTGSPSIGDCGEHGVWSPADEDCVCDDGWETVGFDPCSALISSVLEGDESMGELASSDGGSGGSGGLVIAILLVVIIIAVACFFLWRFYRTRGFVLPTLRLPSLVKPEKMRKLRTSEVSIL